MSEKSLLLDEISNLLMDCDIFKNFPAHDIQAVARYFGLSELKEGESIFREGDAGTFMCIVGSGDIAVLKSNLDGKRVTLATLREGRTFGEMALLDGERRSATCIAATDCVLLTLSQDSLNKMLEDIYWKKKMDEAQLKEFIGHTPVEVLAGAALGILVSLLLYK